jgi:P27 family predicted phage terminase small subunit
VRGIARAAWDAIGGQLVTMGVMTVADAPALELLCLAYQEYRQAADLVLLRGSTYRSRTPTGYLMRKRPEVQVASDAWRRVKAMLVELGLTPAARTRLEATAEPLGTAARADEQFLFGGLGGIS